MILNPLNSNSVGIHIPSSENHAMTRYVNVGRCQHRSDFLGDVWDALGYRGFEPHEEFCWMLWDVVPPNLNTAPNGCILLGASKHSELLPVPKAVNQPVEPLFEWSPQAYSSRSPKKASLKKIGKLST